MKRSFVGTVVCIGICACAMFISGSAPAEQALNLSPNKSTRLEVGGAVTKIVVSNPDVADARPSEDGKSVLVTAQQTGSSEIRIIRAKGEDIVYNLVVRDDVSGLSAEIQSLLADVEGLTVKVVGDKIVLDGNLIVKSDYDRVSRIAEAYAAHILNLTRLDRTEMNKYVAEAIERDIALKTVTVKVDGDTATVEGLVFDPADETMALEKARKRCAKVVNLMKLEEIMIETDVHFVILDFGTERTSGFNIMKALSLDVSASANDEGASYGVSAGIMARFNELSGENRARFLAQPHLSTKSGGTGKFHAGGEEYFTVSGTTGGSLEKVEHGVILKVKPTLRGQDRVMNEITLEISMPTAKPQGAFGLDKYETTSTVMCKAGESILISGLSQSLETQFKEKTPLLGDIPIVNMLFREKGRKRTHKELVVVITPRPVFPIETKGEAFSSDREELLEEE